jgi:Ca2+-binding EF-hand superfamily protein
VVLAPTGPIIVEAHVTIDGKPFRLAREKLVDDMLTGAGADGDGKVKWQDAMKSPGFRIVGPYGQRGAQPQQLEAAIKSYDRNRDELVDRVEVRGFLEQFGSTFQLMSVPYGYGYGQADIRELIDTDKSGELSAEELAGTSDRLKSRDANDDDIVDMQELGGGGYGRGYQVRTAGGRVATPIAAAHLLGPAADLVALYESMKQRYAKDGKMTAETLPAAAELLKSLDLNENGEFDAGEAIGLHLAKAHAVLEVKLHSAAGGKAEVAVVSLADTLKRVDEKSAAGALTLAGYGAELRIGVSSTAYAANYKASAQAMLNQYDADKNGYLEKKEFEGQNNAQYFTQQIEAWDADGDGKVFAAEIEADYNRRLAPTMTRVIATGSDHGVSLFGALDASGDNRLGLREMRSAAEQLKRFDKNGDGRVAADEMPSRLEVAFAIGTAAYGQAFGGGGGVVVRGGGVPGAAAQQQGPKWFAPMDTNGDGDVSRREFIGPAEAFEKLDGDGDGLVSRAEAEKAEAK